jgi:hypothetical protein
MTFPVHPLGDMFLDYIQYSISDAPDRDAGDLANFSGEHNHPDISFRIPDSLVNATPCSKETRKTLQTRYRTITNKPPLFFHQQLGP